MNYYKQRKCEDVVAIIVTYNPDLLHLNKLISCILEQVDQLVIVDNTENINHRFKQYAYCLKKITVLELSTNLGIGYAQNKGIEFAALTGKEYVLLLDQDSMPELDMVVKLKYAIQNTSINEFFFPMVAGPIIFDKKINMNLPFIKFEDQIFSVSNPNEVSLIKKTIASGLLINMKVIKSIGGMRSEYFIDCVDTEWLLRLISKGQFAIVVHNAILEHSIGDTLRRIWLLRWRNIILHGPIRIYYQIRNNLLITDEYTDLRKWELNPILFIVKSIFINLIFGDNRSLRFKYIWKGLFHGLLGKSGKLNESTGLLEAIPNTQFEL